jgi:hypothetical protein
VSATTLLGWAQNGSQIHDGCSCELVYVSGIKRTADEPDSLGITRSSGDCRRLSSGAPATHEDRVGFADDGLAILLIDIE